MEGEEDTKCLRPAKKGKGGTHDVSHDGGEVAVGQSSAEAGDVERAEESQRRGARAAAGLEATCGSYQSRKWRR
jgi:hypothetical protein